MNFRSCGVVCNLTMPPGRHRDTGSSFPFCSCLDFLAPNAHALYGGPSLRLEPMFRNSSGTCMSAQPSGGHGRFFSGSQIPEKSGLPSAVRGVGAWRLGAPFGNRGTPAVGYVSHCAKAGRLTTHVTTVRPAILRIVLIGKLP